MMNSLVLCLMTCLLVAGCAKPSQSETATVEQPGGPQTIREKPPSKPTVPAPTPRKPFDPDTRDQGLATTAPASNGQAEQENQSRLVAPTPAEAVTASNQSESEEAVTTTARIRQALIRDEALSFRAKNVVIVTDHRRVVLQGRVASQLEAGRIRDIAGRMTTRPVQDRLVVAQESR